MSEPILAVRNLKKYYGLVKAVEDVSFTINPGETLGLVGESGCGKTTTASCVLGLQRPTSGSIVVNGTDINTMTRETRADFHRSLQAVFQDPLSSLNPRQRIRNIISEPLVANTTMTKRDRMDRVTEVLSQVGLPKDAADLFPHEFSGGQRQRIALARALSLWPKLIVLDEPVSALDVSIRAQIMNLLKDIQDSFGIAYLLIAHDLATVRYMCHRVRIMYLGRIVETGSSDDLFSGPLHPYGQALLSAALPAHPDLEHQDIALPGEVPSPMAPPKGCAFHPRCSRAMAVCSTIEPVLQTVGTDREVACHLYRAGRLIQ